MSNVSQLVIFVAISSLLERTTVQRRVRVHASAPHPTVAGLERGDLRKIIEVSDHSTVPMLPCRTSDSGLFLRQLHEHRMAMTASDATLSRDLYPWSSLRISQV